MQSIVTVEVMASSRLEEMLVRGVPGMGFVFLMLTSLTFGLDNVKRFS